MDHFDEDAARLLAPLRDVDPGLRSGVDVTRAMRTGRRRRRSRLVAAAVGAVAVLGLSALVAPGLVSELRENDPASNLTVDPATLFDMQAFPVQVGTAGGYTPSLYSVMAIKATVSLVRTDGRPGTGEVSIYPMTRFRPDPATAGYIAAPLIEGRRVFWLPDTAASAPTLVMEYGTDRWVQVTLSDGESDLRNRVYHVAESVSLTPVKVQVPFVVSPSAAGLPTHLLAIENSLPMSPPSKAVVKLSFEPMGRTPQVTVTATQGTTPVTTDAYIGGHAAATTPTEIVMPDVDGWTIRLHLDTPQQDFSQDRLEALGATVQFIANGWTDTPIR